MQAHVHTCACVLLKHKRMRTTMHSAHARALPCESTGRSALDLSKCTVSSMALSADVQTWICQESWLPLRWQQLLQQNTTAVILHHP